MATKKAHTKAAAKKAPAKKAAVKRPVGTPSIFTQALADKICNAIADGDAGRKVCKDVGIAQATLYDWLKTKPGFSEQYACARERQADKYAAEIVEIADELTVEAHYQGEEVTLDVSSSAVARNRLRVDARKWVASKLAPKKYGDKLGIGGADDLPPIDVKPQMNDAETAVHLAKILASAGTDIAGLLKK